MKIFKRHLFIRSI